MSDLEMWEELHGVMDEHICIAARQNDIILKQQAELMQLRALANERIIEAAEAAAEEANA